jgi:hypothetical protein
MLRRTGSRPPYDDGLYGLLTLFLGGVALSGAVAHLGAPALLLGFPALLVLAAALEAMGRRRDPSR